eukprot:TRINITY_DN7048_c0_g1_i2.p1 TRINITY_DN7048_c0_g1~~TRINITY_DN7048_c0_g1_i2.p1  ORF type:complete len:103 (+),score=2.00 TRINITY_DN7048_c0_g1_i2:64-372(+)
MCIRDRNLQKKVNHAFDSYKWVFEEQEMRCLGISLIFTNLIGFLNEWPTFQTHFERALDLESVRVEACSWAKTNLVLIVCISLIQFPHVLCGINAEYMGKIE